MGAAVEIGNVFACGWVEVAMGSEELTWSGERLVPSLSGGIVCEHLHRYAVVPDCPHAANRT